METCEVSFDETLPRSSPAFELSGNEEIGASIFEEDDAADGDERTTTRAADPLASETTTDDEGRLLLTPSTTIELFPEAPAVDTGEVTSEAQASQQVQQDHPSDQIISDVGQRTLRSNTGSIVVFAHSAFVANFEPKDIEHTLSDANWINTMQEELGNFERNQVWELIEPPPSCKPIRPKWIFKNKQSDSGVVVRNKARLVA